MAGALASRTKPRNTLAAKIAAGGAGLYVLLLLIPVKGEFQFITPFKMLFARDYTGTGLGVLTGLVGVSVLLLMIIICVKCFQLLGKESYEKSKTGASIIKLWFVQFAVYGFYILFLWLTSVGGDGSAMGMVFIALILGLIKYFLWIMGLFFLIPLGITEIILLGPESAAAPVQEMTADGGERKSTPSSVEQRLEELLSLQSKGLITGEEYEQRKKEILKEI
jgi:hypothetical protein